MRIRQGGWAAIIGLACAVESPRVAPPTDVRVEASPAGPVVSWTRSGDDGNGSRLVRDYQLLRSRSENGPFVPFAQSKPLDGKRPSIVDTSAQNNCYAYVVWALPGRERSSPTERGGQPARSQVARIAGESCAAAQSPPALSGATAQAPERDSGENLTLRWNPQASDVRMLRAEAASGPFMPFVGNSAAPGAKEMSVGVPTVGRNYWFALFVVPEKGESSPPAVIGPVHSSGALFDSKRAALLGLILLSAGSLFYFVQRARRDGHKMFIRRIPGIDALEEAIGRATEMGRPVLYVPGVEETLSTQTIATVLVLGHVAERVARYGAKLRVSVNFPMTLPLAQEAVKQGCLSAGRPDAYNPNDIQWISSEQFAFTAGTNGIILREKPATNIYLGRFYAESLILAETGFTNRAIQIAGTAEIPQLPFFVAACDYTLIGEELYAMSAYLSRQPALLGTLKGGDLIKVVALVLLAVGAGLSLFGLAPGFANFFAPP